jgi:hypothetical protein
MRWEDERFVKVYTRETLTTLRLEWQGRAVLAELFKKVDRAGLLEIGHEDPVAALASLFRMPEEVVRVGWDRLTSGKDPVVTIRDGMSRAIFIPNFLPAQEANQSNTARKQKSRELARARHLVTDCDIESQGVTKGHTRSHAVTPRLDETRVDESRREETTYAASPEKAPAPPPAAPPSKPTQTSLIPTSTTTAEPDSEFVAYVRERWPSVKDPKGHEQNWHDACPAVDLLYEAKKFWAWTHEKPKNKRTNIAAALGSWFRGAQDKPRGFNQNRGTGPPHRSDGPFLPNSREEHIEEQKREDAERQKKGSMPHGPGD